MLDVGHGGRVSGHDRESHRAGQGPLQDGGADQGGAQHLSGRLQRTENRVLEVKIDLL